MRAAGIAIVIAAILAAACPSLAQHSEQRATDSTRAGSPRADPGSVHETAVPNARFMMHSAPAVQEAPNAASPSPVIPVAPNGASPAPAVVILRAAVVRGDVPSAPEPTASARAMGTGGANRFVPPQRLSGPWWAPLASAALPGAGQAQLDQDRFVGYLAIEGFLWIRYLSDRRAGIRQRDAFRDVALRVSRAPFSGPKPQGDFEYYERMEHWIASGVYDTDPLSAGLDPESDSTTFNGAMWLLARRTYWTRPDTPPPPGSPAYLAALAFYSQAAIRPDFQWSWRTARLEQDIYRRHIKESNDAFRHAIQDVGVVIANHVLSTVDAYISLRLRMRAQLQTWR